MSFHFIYLCEHANKYFLKKCYICVCVHPRETPISRNIEHSNWSALAHSHCVRYQASRMATAPLRAMWLPPEPKPCPVWPTFLSCCGSGSRVPWLYWLIKLKLWAQVPGKQDFQAMERYVSRTLSLKIHPWGTVKWLGWLHKPSDFCVVLWSHGGRRADSWKLLWLPHMFGRNFVFLPVVVWMKMAL